MAKKNKIPTGGELGDIVKYFAKASVNFLPQKFGEKDDAYQGIDSLVDGLKGLYNLDPKKGYQVLQDATYAWIGIQLLDLSQSKRYQPLASDALEQIGYNLLNKCSTYDGPKDNGVSKVGYETK